MFALFLQALLSTQDWALSSLVPGVRQTFGLTITATHLLNLILTQLTVQEVQQIQLK